MNGSEFLARFPLFPLYPASARFFSQACSPGVTVGGLCRGERCLPLVMILSCDWLVVATVIDYISFVLVLVTV